MKKTIMSFLIIAAMVSGCKKETVQGPQGAPGTNGTNGNANVASYTTITNNWSTINDDGTNYWYEKEIGWFGITQSIKDKGVVLVYIDDGAGGWIALPYSVTSIDFSTSFNYYVNTYSVTIRITGFDTTFGSPGAFAFNGSTFKIVAIASSKIANIDINDYNQVAKYYNLNP